MSMKNQYDQIGTAQKQAEGNGEKQKYACPICGRLYDTPEEAAWCAKKHTA